MKKMISTMALLALLIAAVPADAQKHRHTPRTQALVDTTATTQTGIEAYSDTVAADTTTTESQQMTVQVSAGADDDDDDYGPGFVITITAMAMMVPIAMVAIVFYFMHLRQKNKLKIMELAVKSGQPIPEELLREATKSVDVGGYTVGIRQCFLGIGLAVFLGLMMGGLGIGIGALIFFIGLGKVISCYLAKRNSKNDADDDWAKDDTKD